MNNMVPFHLPEGIPELAHDLSGPLLRQYTVVVFVDVGGQVSELTVLKHEINILRTLLEVNQLHYIGMFEQRQHIDLLVDAFQSFGVDVDQRHLLDCVEGTRHTPASLVDSRRRTMPDLLEEQVRPHLATLPTFPPFLHLPIINNFDFALNCDAGWVGECS